MKFERADFYFAVNPADPFHRVCYFGKVGVETEGWIVINVRILRIGADSGKFLHPFRVFGNRNHFQGRCPWLFSVAPLGRFNITF